MHGLLRKQADFDGSICTIGQLVTPVKSTERSRLRLSHVTRAPMLSLRACPVNLSIMIKVVRVLRFKNLKFSVEVN